MDLWHAPEFSINVGMRNDRSTFPAVMLLAMILTNSSKTGPMSDSSSNAADGKKKKQTPHPPKKNTQDPVVQIHSGKCASTHSITTPCMYHLCIPNGHQNTLHYNSMHVSSVHSKRASKHATKINARPKRNTEPRTMFLTLHRNFADCPRCVVANRGEIWVQKSRQLGDKGLVLRLHMHKANLRIVPQQCKRTLPNFRVFILIFLQKIRC